MSNAQEKPSVLLLAAMDALAARGQDSFNDAELGAARLAGQVGLERIVEALLSRGLDELAAAGREALLAVFPPPLLLSTDAVARSAERHKTG